MMRKFSAADLLHDLKTVTIAADCQPVGITQHCKLRYVLMTYDDFATMKSRVSGETPRSPLGRIGLLLCPRCHHLL